MVDEKRAQTIQATELAFEAVRVFKTSSSMDDLVRAIDLVYRLAEFSRENFATLAIELLALVAERGPKLEDAAVEKLAELLEFLAPYQESLRVLAFLRFRQGRPADAAALQTRSLGADELNNFGMTVRLATFFDKHRHQ